MIDKELEELFGKLMESGASLDEINFWREIIPSLSPEDKAELIQNMESQAKLFKEKEKVAT